MDPTVGTWGLERWGLAGAVLGRASERERERGRYLVERARLAIAAEDQPQSAQSYSLAWEHKRVRQFRQQPAYSATAATMIDSFIKSCSFWYSSVEKINQGHVS